MAVISYNNLSESEFDNIVSKRDKLQDININQLKLQIHDIFKKDEEISTDFENINKEDVINKAHLDAKGIKNGQESIIDKVYNEYKLRNKKQSVDETLFQRAVKTTIQRLYDKGLFDNFPNADKVIKHFLFTPRRRLDLSEQVKDDIFFININ